MHLICARRRVPSVQTEWIMSVVRDLNESPGRVIRHFEIE